MERVVRRKLEVRIRENVHELNAHRFKTRLLRRDEGLEITRQRIVGALLANCHVKNVHLVVRSAGRLDGGIKSVQHGGETRLGLHDVVHARQETASERALIRESVELELPADGRHAIIARHRGAEHVVRTENTLGVHFKGSILHLFILVREECRQQINGESRRLNQRLEITRARLAPGARQRLRADENLLQFFQALVNRRQATLDENVGSDDSDIAVFVTAKLRESFDIST